MSSGKLIYEAADMVKLLNDYFATVFTKEMNVENFEIRETTLEGDSIKLTDVDITEEKILKALNSVKRNKTEGIDGLNSTLFIECKTGIVLPLKKIFQHSIENSEIPLQWKMANVVPIFKKGSKKDVGNYRPVSLTCHGSKILEKIIKEEIVKFLEDNKKITRSQHGFRSKKSCLTNLLHFMERILEQVDENEPVDIFFFDLQK